MHIKYEILLNQYAQSVAGIDSIEVLFNTFTNEEKSKYLNQLVFFTIQSKPLNEDAELAIKNSLLRSTFTPCVLLRKGVDYNNLKKIINLPEYEWDKVLVLILNLFKIAYLRRYEKEKNNLDKWWYWDLSDKENIDIIMKNHPGG